MGQDEYPTPHYTIFSLYCQLLNGNVFGKLNDNAEYHVTGQAEYLRTSKGNKPDKSAKGYDVFSIYISPSELTVIEGSGNLFSKDATHTDFFLVDR